MVLFILAMEIYQNGPSKVSSCSMLCSLSSPIKPFPIRRGTESSSPMQSCPGWIRTWTTLGLLHPEEGQHHVLQTAHPPCCLCIEGFFGCRHFSKANELLQKYGKLLDWKELWPCIEGGSLLLQGWFLRSCCWSICQLWSHWKFPSS